MKKILLVEDDKTLIDVYVAKLQKEGYAVKLIQSADPALETAKAEKPDLILLDLVYYTKNGELSKEPGFEALIELKKDEQTKNIPIIVFTNLSQDDQAKAIRLGAQQYICKADTLPEDVLKSIKHWLE